MNETLMHIIVDCASFFELVDERVLDAGIALEQLEQMKWRLQTLSSDEKTRMAEFISSFAGEWERESGKDDRWRCLTDLSHALGLTERGEEG